MKLNSSHLLKQINIRLQNVAFSADITYPFDFTCFNYIRFDVDVLSSLSLSLSHTHQQSGKDGEDLHFLSLSFPLVFHDIADAFFHLFCSLFQFG